MSGRAREGHRVREGGSGRVRVVSPQGRVQPNAISSSPRSSGRRTSPHQPPASSTCPVAVGTVGRPGGGTGVCGVPDLRILGGLGVRGLGVSPATRGSWGSRLKRLLWVVAPWKIHNPRAGEGGERDVRVPQTALRPPPELLTDTPQVPPDPPKPAPLHLIPPNNPYCPH